MRKIVCALCILLPLMGVEAARCTGDPCIPGDIHLSAGLVVWHPCHPPYPFALGINAAGDNTTIFAASTKYTGGLKAEAALVGDCIAARLGFLGWAVTDFGSAARVTGANGVNDFILVGIANPVLANPGWINAQARLRYVYQYFDFHLARFLHKRPGCTLRAFANVRWVMRLEQKERLRAFARLTGFADLQRALFEQNSSFTGIGVGVGLAGEYTLWRCWTVGGEINPMIIPGTTKTLRHRLELAPAFGQSNIFVNYADASIVVPAVDIRLKLILNWHCNGLVGTWELGYEHSQYWRVLQFSREDPSRRICADIGFSGPYLMLKIVL